MRYAEKKVYIKVYQSKIERKKKKKEICCIVCVKNFFFLDKYNYTTRCILKYNELKIIMQEQKIETNILQIKTNEESSRVSRAMEGRNKKRNEKKEQA